MKLCTKSAMMFLLAVSLAACSSAAPETSNESTANDKENETEKEPAAETLPAPEQEVKLISMDDFEIEISKGSYTSYYGTVYDNAAVVNITNNSDFTIYSPELMLDPKNGFLDQFPEDERESKAVEIAAPQYYGSVDPGETAECGTVLILQMTENGADMAALTPEMMEYVEVIDLGFNIIEDGTVRYIDLRKDSEPVRIDDTPRLKYLINDLPEGAGDILPPLEGASPYICYETGTSALDITAYNMSESAIDSYLDSLADKYGSDCNMTPDSENRGGYGYFFAGEVYYSLEWDRKTGYLSIRS